MPDEPRQEEPQRRRAGLRPEERDPDEAPAPAGSAGGDKNMAGTPGGGLAAGGLAGTNAPTGGVEGETDELSEGFGVGIHDVSGPEEVGGDAPYSGRSGGAVGGTPAEKRATGGGIPRGGGVEPQGESGADSTVGKDPAPQRKPAATPPPADKGRSQ